MDPSDKTPSEKCAELFDTTISTRNEKVSVVAIANKKTLAKEEFVLTTDYEIDAPTALFLVANHVLEMSSIKNEDVFYAMSVYNKLATGLSVMFSMSCGIDSLRKAEQIGLVPDVAALIVINAAIVEAVRKCNSQSLRQP